MRWQGRRQSENVEDRRRMPARGLAVGGGAGGLIIVLLYLVLGGDPGALLQPAPNGGGGGAVQAPDPQEEPLREFVAVVLADTEDVWGTIFREQFRREYAQPRLVLFSGQVDSACGFASAAVGPFYCPGDQQVYLDLSFFEQMRSQLGAPGDFAMAYVVAHEIGHHVQNQLGLMERVDSARQGLDEVEAKRLQVRLELQADFLAGVWAHHAQQMKQILEEGDIEEALNAASQIGDDRLQQKSQGYVVPDAFTHGSSAQRLKWFRRGLETGDVSRMEELFELPYESL